MIITFIDHNPDRPISPPVEIEGDGLRLIYDRIWYGTELIAAYRLGTSPIGHEDGWQIFGTDGSLLHTLYSDVNINA